MDFNVDVSILGSIRHDNEDAVEIVKFIAAQAAVNDDKTGIYCDNKLDVIGLLLIKSVPDNVLVYSRSSQKSNRNNELNKVDVIWNAWQLQNMSLDNVIMRHYATQIALIANTKRAVIFVLDGLHGIKHLSMIEYAMFEAKKNISVLAMGDMSEYFKSSYLCGYFQNPKQFMKHDIYRFNAEELPF